MMPPTALGMNMRGNATGQQGRQLAGNMPKEKIPSGYRKGAMNVFTPEQMQLFQSLFPHIDPSSFLSRLAGGEEGAFEEMEAPAWRQFQEAQGQLGSRFSGLGMGAQRGSGFKQSAGQLGSDFAMNLASKRHELRRQALSDLMGYSRELLGQRPQEQFLYEKPKKKGFDWGGALGALGGGALGFFAGGPMGAMTGASMGYSALGRGGGAGGGGGGFQSTPGWIPSWSGKGSGPSADAQFYDTMFRNNPQALGF